MPPRSRNLVRLPQAFRDYQDSLKNIAASNPKRRMGCSVTSAASSGVWTSSRNLCFSLSARYSGKARPACRASAIPAAGFSPHGNGRRQETADGLTDLLAERARQIRCAQPPLGQAVFRIGL